MKKAVSAAAAALPERLAEEDALALELCAAQLDALQARAEVIAARRSALERLVESKYSIRSGIDSVDMATRAITRGT